MTRQVERSLVDGTVRGRAMVLSVHGFETDAPEVAWATFDEPQSSDPHASATRFVASFVQNGDDYWDKYTIVLNERAKFLMAQGRMKSMFDIDYTLDDYLEG